MSVGTATADSLSQAISVLSVQLSLQISALSQVISALSQANSVSHAAITGRVDSVQSALSALVAGLAPGGTLQTRVVQGVQSISLSTAVNISGLSVSCAASAVYQLEGMILFNVSAISATGYRLGLVASGLTQTNANGYWQGTSALAVSTGGTGIALVNQPFNGLNSAHFSVVSAGTAAVNIARLEALIVTSTTGGSLQLTGLVTIVTTSMYIRRGSYLRAYRLA